MDGWGHAAAAPRTRLVRVRLGMRGRIHGVDVDTSHFTGNYRHTAHRCSGRRRCPHARSVRGKAPLDDHPSESPLSGDSHTFSDPEPESRPQSRYPASVDPLPLEHLPDGGVARLRYWRVVVDWTRVSRASICRDSQRGLVLRRESYMPSCAKDNMIMPGRAANMGTGGKRAAGADRHPTGARQAGNFRVRAPSRSIPPLQGNYPTRRRSKAARDRARRPSS